MRLKYLGTAAAEGWPGLYCNCEYCNKAREYGGKNIRTRSQALINDDLLIDFPSDTYWHFVDNKLDLSAVKYLFVTHSHIDHFSPTDLFFRSDRYYAHNLTEPVLSLYGNERVLEILDKTREIYTEEPVSSVVHSLISPYQPVSVGDYTITPMRANHAPGEIPLIFHISSHGKDILYLNDTGRLYDEVYDYLLGADVKADLISFDCTFGLLSSGGGHLGLDSCIVERKKMLDSGIADANTKFIINHFSHNGKAIYSDMSAIGEMNGFITSYDGMEIEL